MSLSKLAKGIATGGKWRSLPMGKEAQRALADEIAKAFVELLREEREACAKLAEAQPFYPDTHTGTRQEWVKQQIAAAIRARSGQGA